MRTDTSEWRLGGGTDFVCWNAGWGTACHMTSASLAGTVRDVKTATICQLHATTGTPVREAARYGEIPETDRGCAVAKIVPEADETRGGYSARRKPSVAFPRLDKTGVTVGGSDVTRLISEGREDWV